MLLLSTALFSLLVLVNLLACLWWNLALDEGLSNSWAAYVREWPHCVANGRSGLGTQAVGRGVPAPFLFERACSLREWGWY
jgi:hypothetical protein